MSLPNEVRVRKLSLESYMKLRRLGVKVIFVNDSKVPKEKPLDPRWYDALNNLEYVKKEK